MSVRPASGPGYLAGALVAFLSVAVMAIALSARQPAPPAVAELAPQAAQKIDAPPPEQASEVGSVDAPGAGGGRPVSTTSTTAAEPGTTGPGETTTTTIPKPGKPTRGCKGGRQTEDPQSPRCVPIFEGDNGGDLGNGVTATEIRVAYPGKAIAFEDTASVAKLVTYFNKRFEMYGRQIKLVDFAPSGSRTPEPDKMRQDARKLKDELRVFATLNYADRAGAEHHFYDAAAESGIVSITNRAAARATEQALGQHRPYQWNVLPSTELMMQLYGEFVCKQTPAGTAAQYAGGVQQGQRRKVAIVYQRTADKTIPPIDILRDALARCGHPLTADQVIEIRQGDQGEAQNAILKMATSNVTTVLCPCEISDVRTLLMPEATNRGFFPEWPLSGYIDLDLDNSFQAQVPEQAAHIFGISYRNRLLPRPDMPWYIALKEVDPAAEGDGGNYYAIYSRYVQLLLLASGIQAAGPNLTAETFEAGLHRSEFNNDDPKAPAGRAPFYQAAVGFPGRRHTMTDSVNLWWYSSSESGTVDPSFPGAVCYIDRGVRYALGQIPTAPQPFFQRCRT